MLILPKVSPCKYCGAHKFYKETERFCCSGGELILSQAILPEYIVKLFTGTDQRSKEFCNMIRTYNNHFAYTFIGMHCDEQYQHRDHGIYTVKVQGQVHHFLGDLIPEDSSKKMTGLQFYFYDPEHQISNRMAALPRLDEIVVGGLVTVMNENPYSLFLKHASTLDNIDEYQIFIKSDPGLDQRVYNRPTSTKVVGIWTENEYSDNVAPWDISVYTKSGHSHKVQYYYACYDPLQYVLMFPGGKPGWHENIPRTRGHGPSKKNASLIQEGESDIASCSTFENFLDKEKGSSMILYDDIAHTDDNTSLPRSSKKRKTISCRDYYVYKVQIREQDKSYIMRFGRLLQQYIVDDYVKLESMRLDFFRHKSNQKRLRRENYQGLIDSIVAGVQ
ncbi:hypothetical protein LIER_22770 [Lithospermum erythrorhizon]|uniref:Helitron helicase-like domain-containing protein n=1 Tax=Lithospermum erythrorhizon TaxID=34254 RepID=A0AAV3QXB5_LITER